MTNDEFMELASWVLDRWGNSGVWMNADRFKTDFELLDAADVWAAAHEHARSDERNEWHPKPARLVSLAQKAAQRRDQIDDSRALPERSGNRWRTMDEWRAEFKRLNDGLTPVGALKRIIGDVADTWGDWDRDLDADPPADAFTYDDIVWPEGTEDTEPKQWPGRPHQNDCDHPRWGILEETVGENGTVSTLAACAVCLVERWFAEGAITRR